MNKTPSKDTPVNDPSIKNTKFKHWELTTDIDNVLWLSIDRKGESANSLSLEVLSELESIVNDLETNAPAGLVLQSGKPGSFIVGADVREFDGYDDAEMASDGIRCIGCLIVLRPCRLPRSLPLMDFVLAADWSLH